MVHAALGLVAPDIPVRPGFVVEGMNPSFLPRELASMVPTTLVTVQPALVKGQREYATLLDLSPGPAAAPLSGALAPPCYSICYPTACYW